LKNEPQLIEVFHNYYEQNIEPVNKTSVNNVLSKIDDVINDVATISYSGVQCEEERQCLNAANQLLKTLERGLGNKWNDTTRAKWFKYYTHLYNVLNKNTIMNIENVAAKY